MYRLSASATPDSIHTLNVGKICTYPDWITPSWKLANPAEVCRLLASARAWWNKSVFCSSRVKMGGSPAADVHEMFTVVLLCHPDGVWRVKADTRGRPKTRAETALEYG